MNSGERKFEFKAIDEEGLTTLENISEAPRFNRWLSETIAADLIPGRVLEIGSGIGNIARHLLDMGWSLTLSDLRPVYIQYLEKHLGTHPKLDKVCNLDLVHPDFDQEYSDLLGQYENVYALNVVEHIEADHQAIANARKLLKPGGRLIILVPAYQTLYNGLDKNLFHFRRYNRKTLRALFIQNQLTVRRAYHFNFIGIFGWFFTGRLLGKQIIPAGQMRLYNSLVPFFRLLDKIVGNKIGLSVIVVGDQP